MKRHHPVTLVITLFFVVLSPFATLAAHAQGYQDYYVDAVNGSDKRTGTAQNVRAVAIEQTIVANYT